MAAIPTPASAHAAVRPTADSTTRTLLSRVPEVTLFFWIIKILATTVGETAADNLNETLGFGLTWTTVVMAVLLVICLFFQFRMQRYVAGVYWLAVVLISVVGTLITDNLTDRFGVSLFLSTGVFAVVLAGVFFAWYRSEGTLSIHSITTARRERFYWATVLATFALGTAAGDLTAATMHLGYLDSGILFTVLIAVPFVAWRWFGLGEIAAFWTAYVLTRPLGASFADWFGKDHRLSGLGYGDGTVAGIELIAIIGFVAWLTISGHGVQRPKHAFRDLHPNYVPAGRDAETA